MYIYLCLYTSYIDVYESARNFFAVSSVNMTPFNLNMCTCVCECMSGVAECLCTSLSPPLSLYVCVCVCVVWCVCLYWCMGWLRLVGSITL